MRYNTPYKPPEKEEETYVKERKAIVNVSKLNLRHLASTESTIDAVLDQGTTLKIISEEVKNWIKVMVLTGMNTNRSGYVMKKFIEEI